MYFDIIQLQQRLTFKGTVEICKVWQSFNQSAAVGLFGIAKKSIHWRSLDNFAAIHNSDLIGRISDHAHIVRDQQHRQLARAGQASDQRQHLLLNSHIKCSRRLVSDENIGLAG